MRIKEVCEKMGLTDKSVRYYINTVCYFHSSVKIMLEERIFPSMKAMLTD